MDEDTNEKTNTFKAVERLVPQQLHVQNGEHRSMSGLWELSLCPAITTLSELKLTRPSAQGIMVNATTYTLNIKAKILNILALSISIQRYKKNS
jgi:hypothetical protein